MKKRSNVKTQQGADKTMYFYSGSLNEGSSTSDDVPLRTGIRMGDAKHLERYSHIMKSIISKLLISFLLGSTLISLWEHSVSRSSPTKTSRPRRREPRSSRSLQDGWKTWYLRVLWCSWSDLRWDQGQDQHREGRDSWDQEEAVGEIWPAQLKEIKKWLYTMLKFSLLAVFD